MLRSLTWKQFDEWRAFSLLEPIGVLREDIRHAELLQVIANIGGRDPKKRKEPFRTDEFLSSYSRFMLGLTTEDDEEVPVEKPKQSVAYMERVLTDWIFVHNATLDQKTETVPPS